MTVTASAYATDTLPQGNVDAVVIGGGAAGPSGALMLAHSRRSVFVIGSGTPRNAPCRSHARHWGRGVVHRPNSHGWEVRDEPIGTLTTGPASVHHALLFRQLTDGLVYFTRGTELDEDTRARFDARDIRVVDSPVRDLPKSEDGGIAGVRLADGTLVARRILAVATRMRARTEGVDGLKLPMEDLSDNLGRRFASGMADATEVPHVWAAGNATDLTARWPPPPRQVPTSTPT